MPFISAETLRLDEAWNYVVEIWKFPIVTLAEAPITVGSLLIASIFFYLGLIASRRLSRTLSERAFHRVIDDRSKAATLESLSYYILLSVFTIISLNIAHIPLTAFTVIGGALAIGVGFGSQNLVNNFISGLILLFERPIKVGDFVEVNGVFGQVEKIGFRSTRLRAPGNKHILFPNSMFLEKEVINWTLETRDIGAKISVSVAYGSPTRQVSEILLQCATSHHLVIKKPEPSVIFADFGADGLQFDLFFSVKLEQLGAQAQIASDIRFKIEERFKEAKISIPFPQREVRIVQGSL